jgi:hypothetical protein
MSRFSLVTHIALIGIAVAIGWLYIKPTVEKIAVVEDQTALYKEEAQKVSEVNQLLAQKLSVVDSITPADKDNLVRYLPDAIDDIAVMKDVVAIFNIAGVDVSDITYEPAELSSRADQKILVPGVVAHDFTLSATVSFDELVSALRALEVNNYLLQVTSLKLTPDDTGLLKMGLTLTAYTKEPRAVEESVSTEI